MPKYQELQPRTTYQKHSIKHMFDKMVRCESPLRGPVKRLNTDPLLRSGAALWVLKRERTLALHADTERRLRIALAQIDELVSEPTDSWPMLYRSRRRSPGVEPVALDNTTITVKLGLVSPRSIREM